MGDNKKIKGRREEARYGRDKTVADRDGDVLIEWKGQLSDNGVATLLAPWSKTSHYAT